MVLEEEVQYLAIVLTVRKTDITWLAVIFNTADGYLNLLKVAILDKVEGVPIGLQWKMILLGTQGTIPKEQQIKALHVYINEPNHCS